MSTPVADNPAATNPLKHLSPARRDALLAIDFYRHQRVRPNGRYEIGSKTFSKGTIAALEDMELIRKSRSGLRPTLAGELAVARLKGETR